MADRWLIFTPAPPGTHRIALYPARENTPTAVQIAQTELLPSIIARKAVELDFAGMDLCTQSWLHALLFEAVRIAWALRVPIHAIHADPAVTEGLRFLESYALGG
ncbi:MAG: hypothetical protein IPK82_39405 [Polyangiaceae bacterium]|nr:hypothetical protein [Polyangiaceae bacterium]